MAKAHQLPSGSWRVRIRRGGKDISYTAPTKEEVELWETIFSKSKAPGFAKPKRGQVAEITGRVELKSYYAYSTRKALKFIDKMDGGEFEGYCKLLLQCTGLFPGTIMFNTPIVKDFGADILIDCDDDERIVIQCKRSASNIGVGAVQEICTAREYYQAMTAVVMTNARFTKAAKELAHEANVELIDRSDMLAMIAIANRYIEMVSTKNQWDILREAVNRELETNEEITEILKYC